MTLAQRIKKALDATGLRANEVAKRVGVSPAAVTQWLDGSTKTIKGETAAALERETKFRAAWLVSGKGPERVDQQMPTLSPVLAWEHEDDLPPGEFALIRRFLVKLSAGNGHEHIELEFTPTQPQAFRADWIRKMRLKPKALAAMVADGRSMEPLIADGDSLVIDTSQTSVIDGKVYALWYDGGERVKRLFRLPAGGLRVQSDNPEFPPLVLTAAEAEHVRIIGRVVHRAGEGGL